MYVCVLLFLGRLLSCKLKVSPCYDCHATSVWPSQVGILRCIFINWKTRNYYF